MEWGILDPLAYYRDELEPAHRTNVSAAFDALLARSGVSLSENRAAVTKLKALKAACEAAHERIDRLAGQNAITALLLLGCGLAVLLHLFLLVHDGSRLLPNGLFWGLLAAAIGAGLMWPLWLLPALQEARQRHAAFTERHRAQLKTLREQVAPLHRLLDWNTVNDLLMRSVPELELDAYLPAERLREFLERFGGTGKLLEGKSVVALQTGTIAGNPFFIVRTKGVRMVERCYEGSRTVHWVESQRDSRGNRVMVHRSQTLYAQVYQKAPEFDQSTFLLYGHDAAPTLTFSRKPSEFSGEEKGFFQRLRMRQETKRLEDFSRNLDDEYGFTIMANREFETLFHSTDRSDESRFRLLFTPLAQQQMVRLLNDTEVGYGDDFTFIKKGKTNLILADHLKEATLGTGPERFAGYELDAVRRMFCQGIQEDLRHLWFALAPLLTIPLYREPAPRKAEVPLSPPSDWEHELQANALGAKRFAHPTCITDCILHAETTDHYGAASEARIRAHGFAGKKRVEYVSVRAANGRCYDVPVPWIEYRAVHRDTPIRCTANISARERRHIRTEFLD